MPTLQVRGQIEAAGWRIARQRGSRRHEQHRTKPGIVTIAGKPSDDLPANTWNWIEQQAGI